MKNRIYELNSKKLGEMVDDIIKYHTPKVIDELIEMLYLGSTDKAHGVKHIHDVLGAAYELKKETLTSSEILAIVFHDVAVELGRNGHEINSKNYWLEFVVPNTTQPIDPAIAEAIAEHRASFKGSFTSKVSELVSAADRGCPKSLDNIIGRSYTYAIDNGASHEEALEHALAHIKHKYGKTGYANFPPIYKEHYKIELEKFYRDIENLNIETVRNTIEGDK